MVDFLKTPFGESINDFAIRRASDVIAALGRALPCSVVSVQRPGAIVTVKFELQNIPFTLPQVRMPVLTSEYFRMPIQPGCRGMTVAADALLGGVSGLGGGVADLTQPSNLGALAFAPIGNDGFQAVDGNVATVYGPGGVTLRTQDGQTQLRLSPGQVVITFAGGGQITITPGGGAAVSGMNVTVTGGDVIADGISLKNHRHTGVQPGGGNTGPPV